MKLLSYFLLFISYSLFFGSCSVSTQIAKQANKILLQDTAIRVGHIGISIYEPATGKYLYEHDAEKYFVPASNTKLFTLYAGMKYLGDSLVGLIIVKDTTNTFRIIGTGDPTFLHPAFAIQPVIEFLKRQKKPIFIAIPPISSFGPGWAWDDYMGEDMVPKSGFPIYGNLVEIKWINKDSVSLEPAYFNSKSKKKNILDQGFEVIRSFEKNEFSFTYGNKKKSTVPFISDQSTVMQLLMDTLHNIVTAEQSFPPYRSNFRPIYSQPSDSLFKPMMHNSDNFFAEQTLLMVSIEHLGYMDDEKIIDTLLRSDLNEVPQKPRWVDGSGLSRYNQFTPKDFVYILNKMKNEFGFDRMKNILATGGEGTLANYYNSDSGHIYAKTGTLSNHLALSGYLITKNNRFFIFSILVNHYQTQATPVRRAIERFLKKVRKDY